MTILSEKLRATFEPVFDVVTREIELENQGVITRHIVRHAPCVSILVYDPTDMTFYLGNEYRSGVNEYRFGNAAGFIDEGETPLEAAKRELREELGLISRKPLEFITTLSSSEGFTDEETHVFYAEGPFDTKATNFDSDEYVKLVKLSVNELGSMIGQNTIKSSPTVVGYYWWLYEKMFLGSLNLRSD